MLILAVSWPAKSHHMVVASIYWVLRMGNSDFPILQMSGERPERGNDVLEFPGGGGVCCLA